MGSTIVSYLMKGPYAVEQRLKELDDEFLQLRLRLKKLIARKSRLRSLGLSRLVPGGGEMFRRTLQEIRAERRALRALLGNHLRTWEIKDAGPAPSV
jgi:hypothetical protein